MPQTNNETTAPSDTVLYGHEAKRLLEKVEWLETAKEVLHQELVKLNLKHADLYHRFKEMQADYYQLKKEHEALDELELMQQVPDIQMNMFRRWAYA